MCIERDEDDCSGGQMWLGALACVISAAVSIGIIATGIHLVIRAFGG